MDSGTLILLVIVGIYAVAMCGILIRELFFFKKEKMREPRTESLVNGKEVIERMLKEANIEGVTVVPRDALVQRYYYSPRKKQIVVSTHACYNSGYYEVMRAATTAVNAIQREEGFGMIDLYLWLAPIMEWMARVLPMFFVVILYVFSFNPLLFGVLAISLWGLLFVCAFLMHPIDRDAARRSTEWLLANGVVAERDRKRLEKIGRYLTNYNLMLVATAGFVLIGLRGRMRNVSDKSV